MASYRRAPPEHTTRGPCAPEKRCLGAPLWGAPPSEVPPLHVGMVTSGHCQPPHTLPVGGSP